MHSNNSAAYRNNYFHIDVILIIKEFRYERFMPIYYIARIYEMYYFLIYLIKVDEIILTLIILTR